jgi:hypothetical protein
VDTMTLDHHAVGCEQVFVCKIDLVDKKLHTPVARWICGSVEDLSVSGCTVTGKNSFNELRC